ncbi:DUF1847 domain-containing protein [Clostridiales bacterium]
MEQDKTCFSCNECGLQNCQKKDSHYPPFCPTTQKTNEEELETLNQIYSGEGIDGQIARNSARIEAEYYCKKTRVEETILFIQKMGFQKVGIATCVGLLAEAKTFAKILKNNGIASYMVICKVGGQDKSVMGLQDSEKVRGGGPETMCNPILQAKILNREHTDLNIAIGLCVGHDSLFYKYSDAPVTTLIAKDRVLAHNPAGALYSKYYRRLYE